MRDVILIAAAGALGALGRWGIGLAAGKWLGTGLPYGTLIVNILGCFLISLIMHIGLTTDIIPPALRLAVTVGFLGALTTFSTFGYETISLFREERFIGGIGNIAMNLIFGLAAITAGLWVGRLITGGD
jgi:CrcB protein